MPNDASLIVLGGGCAGLSLAFYLSQLGAKATSTLVIEQRKEYFNDRTWCFWGDDDAPFAQHAAHQWQHVYVTNGEHRVRIECGTTPYRMLSSDRFYAATMDAIEKNKSISVRLGVHVLSEPEYRNGLWYIETSQGVLCAPMVVDTRPHGLSAASDAVLWQSFYGQEIEVSGAVFDPLCADLMDFVAPNKNDIAFTYTLPLSKTRALVEFTVFAASPLQASDLNGFLAQSIAQRTRGLDVRILRSEYGLLPMGITKSAFGPHSVPTNTRAGLTAGAGRPSTGYAFQRIQRWAQLCTQAIAKGQLPCAQPQDPWVLRKMDRLFLHVLRHHPERAPALFSSLFERAESQRVIRFLNDQARLRDYADVVLALPANLFLKHLFARMG